MRFALMSWMAFCIVYELFALAAAPSEILAGAAVAAIAAWAFTRIRGNDRHHFQFPAGAMGKLTRVPLQVARDCVIVLGANLRRPFQRRGNGRFQVRPFAAANEHPAARMRRTLVTLGISAAPNTIAIGVTETGDGLLVHELAPEPETERDPQWPL